MKPEFRATAPRITDFGDPRRRRGVDAAGEREQRPDQSYTLSISPAAPDRHQPGGVPRRNSLPTWTGLAERPESTPFPLGARAQRREGSVRHRAAARRRTSAAPPNAPGKPTISNAEPIGSDSQITVQWPEVTGGDANGDSVMRYQVQRKGGAGATEPVTVSAPTRPAHFYVVPVSQDD